MDLTSSSASSLLWTFELELRVLHRLQHAREIRARTIARFDQIAARQQPRRAQNLRWRFLKFCFREP